jgi:proline dehydrogenase
MGLRLDVERAYTTAEEIVQRAKELKNFVRLDMEDSSLTQATIDIYWRLRANHDNVGVVLQAYLYRTTDDIEKLIARGGSVRLCKGAYKEPPHLAMQSMPAIRQNFANLTDRLLAAVHQGSEVYPAIATHDDLLIDHAIRAAERFKIGPDRFEFQMLYGLRRKLALQLVKRGFKVRAYVPFGTQWAPYFYRRLRERKENWLFVLGNLFRD